MTRPTDEELAGILADDDGMQPLPDPELQAERRAERRARSAKKVEPLAEAAE